MYRTGHRGNAGRRGAVADELFNQAVSEKVADHGKERMLADSPRGRISIKNLPRCVIRHMGRKL